MKKVFFLSSIVFLFMSCEFFSRLTDTVPPEAVSNLNLIPGNGSLLISWDGSSSEDLKGYKVSWAPDGTFLLVLNPDINSYNIMGLTNGTEYTVVVVAYDFADNESEEMVVTGTPESSFIYTEEFHDTNWDTDFWDFGPDYPDSNKLHVAGDNLVLGNSNGDIVSFISADILGANAEIIIELYILASDENNDDVISNASFELIEPSASHNTSPEFDPTLGEVWYQYSYLGEPVHFTAEDTMAFAGPVRSGDDVIRFLWLSTGFSLECNGTVVDSVAYNDMEGAWWDLELNGGAGDFNYSGTDRPSFSTGFKFNIITWVADPTKIDYIYVYTPS